MFLFYLHVLTCDINLGHACEFDLQEPCKPDSHARDFSCKKSASMILLQEIFLAGDLQVVHARLFYATKTCKVFGYFDHLLLCKRWLVMHKIFLARVLQRFFLQEPCRRFYLPVDLQVGFVS